MTLGAKRHVHGIAIFPNFKQKYLDLKVLRFFLLITFYCHKYLQERSTKAGTQAKPTFLSYDRSKCNP